MAQIKKKFIGNNEVGAAKIRLENGSSLRARNFANDGDVNLIVADGASDTIFVGTSTNARVTLDAGTSTARLTGGDGIGTVYLEGLQINVVSDGSEAPAIYLFDDDNSNSIGLQAPSSVATDFVLKLPATAGSSGQVLTTDGSGNLSWSTVLTDMNWADPVNANVVPDTDNTRELGSPTVKFAAVHTAQIDGNGADVTVFSSLVPDSGGPLLNLGLSTDMWDRLYANYLYDATDAVALDVNNRIAKSTSGVSVLDFATSSYAKILGDGTGSGKLQLNRFSNDFSVTLQANDSMAADTVYVLPAADGSSGQILSTDGAGALSWITPSAPNFTKTVFTLVSGDITNQYIDLSYVALNDSIDFVVDGVVQREGADYTVNYTGGAGGNTRLTFAGDLATGGSAALVAGDVVVVKAVES